MRDEALLFWEQWFLAQYRDQLKRAHVYHEEEYARHDNPHISFRYAARALKLDADRTPVATLIRAIRDSRKYYDLVSMAEREWDEVKQAFYGPRRRQILSLEKLEPGAFTRWQESVTLGQLRKCFPVPRTSWNVLFDNPPIHISRSQLDQREQQKQSRYPSEAQAHEFICRELKRVAAVIDREEAHRKQVEERTRLATQYTRQRLALEDIAEQIKKDTCVYDMGVDYKQESNEMTSSQRDDWRRALESSSTVDVFVKLLEEELKSNLDIVAAKKQEYLKLDEQLAHAYCQQIATLMELEWLQKISPYSEAARHQYEAVLEANQDPEKDAINTWRSTRWVTAQILDNAQMISGFCQVVRDELKHPTAQELRTGSWKRRIWPYIDRLGHNMSFQFCEFENELISTQQSHAKALCADVKTRLLHVVKLAKKHIATERLAISSEERAIEFENPVIDMTDPADEPWAAFRYRVSDEAHREVSNRVKTLREGWEAKIRSDHKFITGRKNVINKLKLEDIPRTLSWYWANVQYWLRAEP